MFLRTFLRETFIEIHIFFKGKSEFIEKKTSLTRKRYFFHFPTLQTTYRI